MPDFDPSFSDLTPSIGTPFNVSQWYYSSFMPGVPDTVAPFLAAHGFLVNGGGEHYIDGEFAGYLLNMTRFTFSHADAIQVMLNAMVFAYNEGRTVNDRRYEDLVANLDGLLTNHQADIRAFIDNSVTEATSGYVTLLLSSLDLLTTDHASLESDLYSYDTGDRETELTRLKTIWQDAATTLEAEYSTMTAGLDIPGLIADVDVSIDALDAALTRFTDEHAGLAATLLSDFNSHVSTATAFLTGLGTTELARINERFDDLTATNNNRLVDRGFYSSALVTQMEAQVERERNEAIGELNDRLNREKFENQHRLYEQKYRMRLGALETSYRVLQGASEVLSARLQHGQWASRIRHEVAQLSIAAKLNLLGLREKYYQFLLQSISWQTDRRMKIYDALFQSRLEAMRVRQSAGAFHSELIRYQLDSRNNLALAMFGFVERREDSYPDIGDMSALIGSLGDDQ
jgi:hypothetical protein